MESLLIILGFFAFWFFLQVYLLPKLGVAT
jgi:hypothetical protein